MAINTMKKIPLGVVIQSTRKPGFGNYHQRTARKIAFMRAGVTFVRVLTVLIAATGVVLLVRFIMEVLP